MVIIGAVIVANGAAVLGLVTTDPLAVFGGVSAVHGSTLPGLPFIDGNAGYVTQALGHRAATDWLHGHVPWWNPYEGVGTPLVAEGQNGALFPPVLLLAWSHGLLALRLLLEASAGWATYFLAHRLGLGRVSASGCGVAYGLCGTFAWFNVNPGPLVMPWLPLALLGVERAADAARQGRPLGWRLLAVSVGLSAVAGFPETAFIDTVLVALWALARLVPLEARARRALGVKVLAGLALGGALAAPFEAAFLAYLPHAQVGGHAGGFSTVSLHPMGLAQLILPYGFGPILAFHSVHGPDALTYQWGAVGGYLGVMLVFTGLLGVMGARRAPLRWALVAWTALCLLRSYGFAPVVHALAPLPGFHQIAFFRYDNPSWTLAVIVLGGFGVDDLVRGRLGRRGVVLALGAAAACTAWAAVEAWHVMSDVAGAGSPHRYVTASILGAGVLLVLAGGAALAGAPARRPDEGDSGSPRRFGAAAGTVLACAMGAEAAVLLGVTQLSAPTTVSSTTGAVAWLARHLGTARFATLGPIQPNYGSSFGIAEVDTQDLPVPIAWNRYISSHLDPNAPPFSFTGGARENVGGPTPAQELASHLAGYEAVGVRYVVEWAVGTDVQKVPFPPPGARPWRAAGPRRVYRDSYAEIWELGAPAPLFSIVSAAGSCHVRTRGWDRAVVSCPSASTLVRRVLALPGWSAEVAGRSQPVRAAGPEGLFQSVQLAPGTQTVSFTYHPPGEPVAVALFGAAFVLLVASFLDEGRTVLTRRASRRGGTRLTPGEPEGAPAP